MLHVCRLGAIQVLRNADGGVRGVKFSGEKRYEDVRFNVISVTRGWVGVQLPGKKCYVTLEWPLVRSVLVMFAQSVICRSKIRNTEN